VKQELNQYLTYVIVLNGPAINIISSKKNRRGGTFSHSLPCATGVLPYLIHS
jgi:hypothetical protein